MRTGAYISASGHGALLLWALIGGFFATNPELPDFSATDVSIISAEEFAELLPQSPETAGEPDALTPPAIDDAAVAPAQTEPNELPQTPTQTQQADADASIEAPQAPAQPLDVFQNAPEQPTPEGDDGALTIVPDATPQPEAAPRVAPEAAPIPEPDVTIDEVQQAETAPSPDADQVEEAQEETAPEAATTEIVTEAEEEPSAAPTLSKRPGARPARSQVAEAVETEPEQPTTPGLAETIASAVAEANETEEDNASPGLGTASPITRAEKQGFILGIQKCWNVGALGTDALGVTVVVGFSMDQQSKPVVGSISLLSATGGQGAAVDRAYEAARRAIIRCGAQGYGLPAEKYALWRDVEVTFNASRKEIR